MNKFSKVPFKLNEDEKKNGDLFLLKCLKEKDYFTYLSDDSRKEVDKLELDDKKRDFRFLHQELIELWPLILTDSLLELKKHDTEEYDQSNEKMDTFFDPASLGTTELKEVLKGFSEFEGMMYGASPSRYRDHIAHSFRVWIVGQGILKNRFSGELSSPTCFIQPIRNEEWECMWALVALCHDIGYPLSQIEKINERARQTLRKQGLMHEADLRFSFSQQMLPFHDTIIKLMASDPVEIEQTQETEDTEKPEETQDRKLYLTHLQNKYYLKLLKSFDNLDHGIISSLLISKALVYFLESDFSHDSRKPLDERDIRQFFIRREILRAIAAHTCQDIYHLTFDNLSVLLYIVDEIQFWGRPTLEESEYEAVNIPEGWAEVGQFNNKEIDITITTKDKEWNDKQQKGVLIQVLKLRRMLRLAVGSKKHLDRELRFEVCNKGKQILRLQLKNKSLEIYQKGINSDIIESVPKLKSQIKKIT